MFQTNVDIHKRELSRRGNMRGFWKCASVVASEACINIAFLFLDFCAFRICDKSVPISVKPNFASKYVFESSRRDLHDALLCTALKSHFSKTN